MKVPGSTNAQIGFSTDNRKKLVLEVNTNGSKGYKKYSSNWHTGLDLTYKPTDYLSVTVSPGFSKSFNQLQYVTHREYQ